MADTMCIHRESANLGKPMKRSNKPLMEKRRRERINSSLDQLKGLVLESLRKDTSQYSKLEKADILEMTVKHLRGMQRQQLHLAAATDNTVVSKYRAGFTECAQEVTRYLGQVDGLTPETRSRLMQHLGNCMQQINTHMPPSGGVHPAMMSHAASLQMAAPRATPYSTLPGAPTNTSPHNQHQMSPTHQQQMAALIAAAQLHRTPSSTSIPQSTSPVSSASIPYMANIQMVPLSSPETFHHNMSPVLAAEAPQGHYPHMEHSPVSTHSQSSMTSLNHSGVTNTELKIEIPLPSPCANEVESKTPILKCVSPYPLQAQDFSRLQHSRIPVAAAMSTERVWRPW